VCRQLLLCPARCSLCPLFDTERAIRDVMGASAPSAEALETALGVKLWALLRRRLPSELGAESGGSLKMPEARPFG
jgi:hypothetical protein